ncbi:50S ribosomal protein L6 [Candidatus Dependentiae bacterium]|nr:50S ribosomal protein L6 [Candidatus Dependentiae bacterium]
MSKIGRKPINTEGLTIAVNGQNVSYKGPKKSGTYVLPECLNLVVQDNLIRLELKNAKESKDKNLWGLHRALLANELQGAREEFSVDVTIVGLGFKGELKGDTIVFSLGYSHKIDFSIPKEVSVTIDKTGQNLIIKSSNKFLAGDVAQKICALRRPEPYKGTGVRLAKEQIFRKVGKN